MTTLAFLHKRWKARIHWTNPACALALLLALLGAAVPARADVGVQPVLPVGSDLKPGAETPVQMAAEVVTITVREAAQADNALLSLNPKSYGYDNRPVWYQAVAEVEADFTMKNPRGEDVSMTVWFPLASALEQRWELNPDETVPRIESFRAAVNGQPLVYAVSDWPNPQGADKLPLPWASFPVTFAANAETLIHVSYRFPLQPIPKQPALALSYVFQTGAGWAGPIGKAELILNLPYPASAETLARQPAGAALAGNQARWTWQNFEPGPQNDFSAWLLKPDVWRGLKEARARAEANPQNGQTWLDLAAAYGGLSLNFFSFRLSCFGPVYLPQAVAAYQQAAALLPDHPAPHAGLGLMKFAQHINDPAKPTAPLTEAREEYRIAKELDAANPALMPNAGSSSNFLLLLEEVLYPYNDTTATAEAAQLTALSPTLPPSWTPRPTFTPRPTLTPRPTASRTPSLPPTYTAHPPSPTLTPTAVPNTVGSEKGMGWLLALGGLGAAAAAYLAARGMRKSAGKDGGSV